MKPIWVFLNLVVALCSVEMALAQTCPAIRYGIYNCIEQTTDAQTMIKVEQMKMPTTGQPAIQIQVEKISDLKIPPQECLNKTQTVKYCTAEERNKDAKAKEACDKQFGANSLLVSSLHESSAGRYKVDSKMMRMSLDTSQIQETLDILVDLNNLGNNRIDLKVQLVDAQKNTQNFHWECAY